MAGARRVGRARGSKTDHRRAARGGDPQRGCRNRPFCFSWWPDWRGERCLIVASGPSAKDANVDQARGRCRVIAINESWRLAPWADALYACDGAWWRARGGVPEFRGLKLSQDSSVCTNYRDIHHVTLAEDIDHLVFNRPGLIGGGGNSGFQALNLAIQFGAREIIMVGFDMHVGGGAHWHGRHTVVTNNPTAPNTSRWRARLDAQAPRLRDLGVTVLNAAPNSALTAFPKMTLEEALHVTDPRHGPSADPHGGAGQEAPDCRAQ